MKPLSNKQLEDKFTALQPVRPSWRGLDILALESIQLNAVVPELLAIVSCEDEAKQLIWYWLGKQCQYKAKAAYKGRDVTNNPANWHRPWYNSDTPSGALLQTRVLELAEFIRNYKTYDKKLGKSVYPNPLVAMTAWQRRFYSMELRRQLHERAGISSDRADLAKMAQVMRFLPVNNDIDLAVVNYTRFLESNYEAWLQHHKTYVKAPQLPTKEVLKKFRKDCVHYVQEVKPRTENILFYDTAEYQCSLDYMEES